MTKPLAKPEDLQPGEYIDRCHWSPSGWAVWKEGSCTCRPARKPKQIISVRQQEPQP